MKITPVVKKTFSIITLALIVGTLFLGKISVESLFVIMLVVWEHNITKHN